MNPIPSLVQSRCYNAPTSHRAGWAIPMGTYTGENITAGTWMDFSIPAMEVSDKNFVKVRMCTCVLPVGLLP